MKSKKQLKEWESEIQSKLRPTKKDELKKFMYNEMLEKCTEPQRSIVESRELINLFLAGQGSGKTQCMGYLSLFFATNFPEAIGFIAANTYLQLEESTLVRIYETWAEQGYKKYDPVTGKGDYVVGTQPPKGWTKHHYEKWDFKIVFRNGALIFLGSLDNYQAHEGKQVAWMLLDETKYTKETAITEVLGARVRQQALYIDAAGNITSEKSEKDFMPLYIFTSPVKISWLNRYFNLDEQESEIKSKIFSRKTFFAKKTAPEKFVSISSSYLNPYLSERYLEKQKNSISTELQDMLIWGCPFSKSGGEFYKQFDRQRHVGKCEYNPYLPLHLTFDFNVSPYVTLCVWQIDGKNAYQIAEVLGKYPDNTTKGVCKLFKKRFFAHESGVFIYGDPAGQARDTRAEQGWNDYTIIMHELREFKPALRVEKTAPSVVGRGLFVNDIFAKNFEGIRIVISEDCSHTIDEYTFIQEAPDGRKLKKKKKNPETGAQEEEYGHISDANDYFLCRAFLSEMRKFENGGIERKEGIFGKFLRNFNR